MCIQLSPTSAFAQNMEIEDNMAKLTLELTTDNGTQRFGLSLAKKGLYSRGMIRQKFTMVYGWYELKVNSIDYKSMESMQALVDAAVEIGSSSSTNPVGSSSRLIPRSSCTEPVVPACPHCGVEMGEGGTTGALTTRVGPCLSFRALKLAMI